MISNCMPFVHQPSIPFPYPYTITSSTLCHFTPISLKSFQSALLHSPTNYFTLLHFTPPHITPNPIPSPHSSQLSLTPCCSLTFQAFVWLWPQASLGSCMSLLSSSESRARPTDSFQPLDPLWRPWFRLQDPRSDSVEMCCIVMWVAW